jgi:DNA-directed RNA polymerase subunit M/transcription elongation factor TFIIS
VYLDCSPNVLGPATHTFKRCKGCGEFKPLDAFSRHPQTRDKLQPTCRDCASAIFKAWRAENKDYHAQSMKAWYEANKEKVYATVKAWKAEHRDRVNEGGRKYHAAHKEQRSATTKAWAKANPDKRKASYHRRRARVAETGGTLTAAELAGIRAAQTDKRGRLICWKCGKPIKGTPHLDHWQPLKHGGMNSPGNLHYMHGKCNLEKGAKLPAEIGRLL